ncbi:hypothetical protein ATI61_110358 [Archangium gephyra]|uniref:STAS/SEC14 domain-containing protein n=1 Tax=Archangium gephyra TaxID=48 RepID=A0AAC8THI2_9BACT|nr:hypothetical protein [Archangium gephyra]AKJ05895.1 Hypothetical protein AA314_07521 [Archangium gephyra]REG27351.1 hypothetical protein ATI61_110358 [Archangium gephyra]
MSVSRGVASIDDSHWPLLITRIAGEMSNQEFDDYLARSIRTMGRGQPHVLVVDLSQAVGMSPEQRQRLEQWSREHDEAMQRTVVGAAYITPTAVVRLALSVLLYVRRPSYPYVIVTREQQALEWAIKRLEDVGLHAPASRLRRDLGLISQPRAG